MKDKLPRYEISIDQEHSIDGEKLGITQVAYVEEPAIITKGIAFNVDKMTFSDNLKLRVAAPALIPNLPIYRFDDEMGEYEVVFTKDMIEQLRQDFMLNKGSVTFNLDHDTKQEAPSYILDSWITQDSETDPSFTKYGIKLPEGSWFVVSQFTDKDYFQKEIIDKDRAAYSIEGFLGLSLSKLKQKLNKESMEKQEKVLLTDGEYTLADGSVFTVLSGAVVTELEDKKEDEDEEKEELAIEDIKEDEEKEDELAIEDKEEDKEEELAIEDEVIEDEVIEDEVIENSPIDEESILKIVQPKFDELLSIIAELKTMIETSKIDEEVSGEVAMSRLDFMNDALKQLRK
jgi:hypothetical protein